MLIIWLTATLPTFVVSSVYLLKLADSLLSLYSVTLIYLQFEINLKLKFICVQCKIKHSIYSNVVF